MARAAAPARRVHARGLRGAPPVRFSLGVLRRLAPVWVIRPSSSALHPARCAVHRRIPAAAAGGAFRRGVTGERECTGGRGRAGTTRRSWACRPTTPRSCRSRSSSGFSSASARSRAGRSTSLYYTLEPPFGPSFSRHPTARVGRASVSAQPVQCRRVYRALLAQREGAAVPCRAVPSLARARAQAQRRVCSPPRAAWRGQGNVYLRIEPMQARRRGAVGSAAAAAGVRRRVHGLEGGGSALARAGHDRHAGA